MNYSGPELWPVERPPSGEYCSEPERLKVLASYDLGSLQGDDELARISRFAARLCKTSVASVSIVEGERQQFIARAGLDATESPRSTSFCAHTMLDGSVLEVLDASDDSRFADFALVTGEMHIRYYAGAPLISPEGAPLGALCVIDSEPRQKGMGALELEGLMVLAQAVMRRLEALRESKAMAKERLLQVDRLRLIAERMPVHVWSADLEGNTEFANASMYEFCGTDDARKLNIQELVHPEDQSSVAEARDGPSSRGEKWEAEARARRHDGEYRWMLIRGWPLKNIEGEVESWFGAAVDIHEARNARDQAQLLARELDHRIKNIFAVVGSLISLRARGDEKVEALGRELTSVVSALGRAQDFVRPLKSEKGEELIGLLEILLAPYHDEAGERISISGDSVTFGSHAATPLALIFHELATNAVKYGALSSPDGKLSVSVKRMGGDIRIKWCENGGPSMGVRNEDGFGSRLVTMAVRHQLGGELDQRWEDTGLAIDLMIPKARLQA